MIDTIRERFNADFSEWPEIYDFFHIQDIAADDHIVRTGEPFPNFFFISEGLTRIYYNDQNGNEINEGFYGESEFLGPISCFIKSRPCEYNIQAIEPCKIVIANYPQFHQFAQDKPDILNFEITFMQSLFISNAKRDSKRMFSSGEQRYRWFCREYAHLLDRVPQYQVASFLGMTPVSLSRLRKNLSNQD